MKTDYACKKYLQSNKEEPNANEFFEGIAFCFKCLFVFCFVCCTFVYLPGVLQ